MAAPFKEIEPMTLSFSNSTQLEKIRIKKIRKYKPPIHCDDDLHIINVGSKSLTLVNIEKPVVVKPDVASKKESINVS